MLSALKTLQCPSCELHFTGKDGYRNYSTSRYPFLLKCSHTVCESCINNSFKLHQNITCAICKTVTPLEPGVHPNSKLLPDVYVIGIVNCKQSLPSLKNKLVPASPPKNENGTVVPCEQCSMREATFRCKNCKENFCNICFDTFHDIKKKKKHVAVPIYANIYHSLIQEGCAEHDNRLIEFYCEKDNELICSHCVIKGEHKEHEVVTLTDKNESCKEELKRVHNEVLEFNRRLKFTEQKLSQSIPSEKVDCSQYVKEIHSHFHSLHSALLLRENLLLQQIEEISSTTTNHIMKLRQEVSDTMKDVEALSRDAACALENSTLPISVPLIIRNLEIVKSSPCHLIPISSDDSNKDICLEFDSNLQNIISEHGRIHAETRPKFCLRNGDELPSDFVIEPLPIEMNSVETESVVSESFSEDSLNLASLTNGHDNLNTLGKYSSPTTKLEKVIVSHIVDPTNFYLRRCSDVTKLTSIIVRIKRFIRLNPDNSCNPSLIKQGDIYLAKYTKDNNWYRARVMDLITVPRSIMEKINVGDFEENDISTPTNEIPAAKVFYIDFGNSEIVPLWSIMEAEREIFRYPGLAKKCSLHNIVPRENNEWTMEANAIFQEYVFNKEVNMQIIEEMGGVMYVDLSQLAPMGDDDVMDVPTSVRDALIFLEHATFFDESVVSKDKKVRNFRQFLPPECISANSRGVVNVTHVETPHHFYVQHLYSSRLLSELFIEMQNIYSKEVNILHSVRVPHVGMICAAQFQGDKMWYRAEVLSLPGGARVEVEFVDFGYKEILHHKYLRKIYDRFTKLNKQAVPCSLADISFLGENGWSLESKEWLISYTKEKQCHLLSLGFEAHSCKTKAVLFYCDGEFEVCINALMVKEEMAEGTGLYATAIKKHKPKLKGSSRHQEVPCTIKKKSIKDGEMEDDNKSKESVSPRSKKCNTKKNSKAKTYDPSRDYVKAILTHIETPGAFFVRLFDMENEYTTLCNSMKEAYNNTEPSNVEIKLNSHYAAYREVDKSWYRIIAASLVEDNAIEARFPDAGYYEKVKVENIRALLHQFAADKSYAVSCFLPDILPAGGSHKWSKVAIDTFCEIVIPHNVFYLAFSNSALVLDNSISVDLFYEEFIQGGALEPSTLAYRSVTQRLIDAGVALPDRNRKRANNMQSASKIQDLPDSSVTELTTYDTASVHANSPSPEKPSTPTPVVRWMDALPPKEMEFSGFITHISDEGTIFLQISPECVDNADMINKALLCKYQNRPFKSLRIVPPIGSACLAEFELDHKYYRAEIIQNNPDLIKVQFVDYGNLENIDLKKIILDQSFQKLPKQCIECELNDVSPPNGNWSTAVLNFMHSSLVEKCCTIKVMEPLEVGKKPVITIETNMGNFNQVVNAIFEKPIENGNESSEDEILQFPPATSMRMDAYLPVCIVSVLEPNLVYLQCLNVESPKCTEDRARNKEILEFLTLVKHLQERGPNFPILNNPAKGMCCLAQYSADDSWCRARIINVDGPNAQVLYVDYGNSESRPLNKLREVDEYAVSFPVQAHICKIYAIEPIHKNWSEVMSPLVKRYYDTNIQKYARVVIKKDIYEVELVLKNENEGYDLLYQDFIDDGLLKME